MSNQNYVLIIVFPLSHYYMFGTIPGIPWIVLANIFACSRLIDLNFNLFK